MENRSSYFQPEQKFHVRFLEGFPGSRSARRGLETTLARAPDECETLRRVPSSQNIRVVPHTFHDHYPLRADKNGSL